MMLQIKDSHKINLPFLSTCIKVFLNKSFSTNRIFLNVSLVRLAESSFFSTRSRSPSVFLFRIDKFTTNALKIVNQYLHLNALLVMYTSEWAN